MKKKYVLTIEFDTYEELMEFEKKIKREDKLTGGPFDLEKHLASKRECGDNVIG